MSTYEPQAATARIREEAKKLLGLLDQAVLQMFATLTDRQIAEFADWMREGRRLLDMPAEIPAEPTMKQREERMLIILPPRVKPRRNLLVVPNDDGPEAA